MTIKRLRMDQFEEARPGVLVGVDYSRGAKVGRPVRVMVELLERKRFEDKKWDWVGEVVKCSPALAHLYMGHKLRINPDDMIAVIA